MTEPRTEAGRLLVGQYHRAMHGEDCELEDDAFIRDRVLLIEEQAVLLQEESLEEKVDREFG